MTNKKFKKEHKCKKCEENLAGWKRALADYENLKKQTNKEKEAFVKFANLNLIMHLIPIYENFKTAFSHLPDGMDGEEWVKGMEHIRDQFKKVLEDSGVEEIVPKKGDKFDVEVMEAVDEHSDKTRIAADKSDIEKIKKVVSTGYKLHGKVFLPAKVIVK